MDISMAHTNGMRAARRFAEWELGSQLWADRIVNAYLNPKLANERLDFEQQEREED